MPRKEYHPFQKWKQNPCIILDFQIRSLLWHLSAITFKTKQNIYILGIHVLFSDYAVDKKFRSERCRIMIVIIGDLRLDFKA